MRSSTALVVVAEEVAEDFKRREGAGGGVGGDEEVVEGEGEDAGRGVFEFGVDLEADEVADDEEGRVFEGFVVLVELLVGLFEVAGLGLVFPGEPAALPDVGEPLLTGTGFEDTLFIGVAGAYVGCVLGGMSDAEGFAEVAEMLLGGGALRERAGVPLETKYRRSVGMGLRVLCQMRWASGKRCPGRF